MLDEIFAHVDFKLPNIPCGVYRHVNNFGEEVWMNFRFIPRAREHRGRFAVFVKDPDAGDVVIGLYNPDEGKVERLGRLYPQYWEAWINAELHEKRCAMCGRLTPAELPEDEFVHESKACQDNLRKRRLDNAADNRAFA